MDFDLSSAFNTLVEATEDFLSLLKFPHNHISFMLCPDAAPACSVCILYLALAI